MSNDLVKWEPKKKETSVVRRVPRVTWEGCPVPAPMRAICQLKNISCPEWIRCPAEAEEKPPVLALPRTCTALNKPAIAYMVLGRDGHYKYSRSGRVTKDIFDTVFSSANLATHVLDPADIEEEVCPWCGVAGQMIYCKKCKQWVCPGTLVGNRWGRCRCGNYVELTSVNVRVVGVVPRSA